MLLRCFIVIIAILIAIIGLIVGLLDYSKTALNKETKVPKVYDMAGIIINSAAIVVSIMVGIMH